MKLVNWYHVYADGHWREPLQEHLHALGDWQGEIILGLVGSPENRRLVLKEITPSQVHEWDSGDEYLTLRELHAWAQDHADYGVLYAQTKGAYSNTPINAAWRRNLTHQLVANHASCVRLLETNDAVGCHYLTSHRYPDKVFGPYFAGNFWWARSEYLARLRVPGANNRSQAELWVGSGLPTPRVVDVYPMWPHEENFGPRFYPSAEVSQDVVRPNGTYQLAFRRKTSTGCFDGNGCLATAASHGHQVPEPPGPEDPRWPQECQRCGNPLPVGTEYVLDASRVYVDSRGIARPQWDWDFFSNVTFEDG